MIWVFTVNKDNLILNQFITDRLPDFETFKRKLNRDELLSVHFEDDYFTPLTVALKKVMLGELKPNDIPHCSFNDHLGRNWTCMGFQGFNT